jgi:hypothetical protein
LTHAAEVEMLQVSQAAMDDLEAVRRCAGSEVSFFHQGHSQSAQCSVTGHARPDNASANDEDIESL